jgi:hypothetical protein
MWRLSRARFLVAVVVGTATAVAIAWLGFWSLRATEPLASTAMMPPVEAADRDKRDKPLGRDKRTVSDEERQALIPRATLWRPPAVPTAQASLAVDTLDHFSCRFKVSELGGTTPKFDCFTEDGEEIRIKYGNGPEVPAEAAATRLLSALGFGADRVTLVRVLRCYGCPREPFSMMKAVGVTRSEDLYKQIIDFEKYQDFQWVALERKFAARPIETDKLEGWSFFELERINPAQGGAPRAHVDAMRLMAVLLAHWDNKSENQRLVCLTRDWPEDTPCPEPFLLMQDVGATFGPTKLDLPAWERTPVWENRAACTVSMTGLPFGGATFGQSTIGEEGRRFLARLLSQLSDAQLRALFTHARFAEPRGIFTPQHHVDDWVRVFRGKIREITDGPRCPATT